MKSVYKSIVHDLLYRNFWDGHAASELIWSKRYNYLYGACSKNGCSSIKYNLALLENRAEQIDGNPHHFKTSGLQSLINATEARTEKLLTSSDTFRFNFCRNPYSRLLSAYENRIKSYGMQSYDDEIPREFVDNRSAILAFKTGLHPSCVDASDPISFEDFIHFIHHQDYFDMDRHWYPQARSMNIDVIDYDFTGRLENFNEDWRKISERILGNTEATSVRLNSNAPDTTDPELISIDIRKLIASKYEEDFDTFRYRTGLSSISSVTEAVGITGARPEEASGEKQTLNIVIDARHNVFKLRETLLSLKPLNGCKTIAILCRDRSNFSDYITTRCDDVIEVDASFDTGFLAGLEDKLSADCEFVMYLTAGERIAAPHLLPSALELFIDKPDTKAIAGLNLELFYPRFLSGTVKALRYRWNNTAGFFLADPSSKSDILATTDILPTPRYGQEKWFQPCEMFSGPFICRKFAFFDFVSASSQFCAMPVLALHVTREWAETKTTSVLFYPFLLLCEKSHGQCKPNAVHWNDEDIRRYLTANRKKSLDLFGVGTWKLDEKEGLSFSKFAFRQIDFETQPYKKIGAFPARAFDDNVGALEKDFWDLKRGRGTEFAQNTHGIEQRFKTLKETLLTFKADYGVSIKGREVEVTSSRRLLRRAVMDFVRNPIKKTTSDAASKTQADNK